GVSARRQDDVAAVAAHINAGTDLARAVADFDVGVPRKEEMPTATWGDGHPGGRERTVLHNELVERGLAVELPRGAEIKVDGPHTARGTHRRTNHGVGVLLPPCEDLRFIPGRIFEAAGGERLLVDRIARKHRSAAAHVIKRGIEHSGDSLRLRAHVTLPPSLKNKLCRY